MAKKKNIENDDLDLSEIAKELDAFVLEDIEPVNQWIDTGILSLNYISCKKMIGGGIPMGRITEVYGDSASGKSLLAMNILKGCQTAGGIAVYLDAEHSISKEFAIKASHIDPKKLLVIEGDTLQECFFKIMSVIKGLRKKVAIEKPIVVIYDSIAASPSEREFAESQVENMINATDAEKKQAGAGSDQPGDRARTCSKYLRVLPGFLREHNAALVVINQIREKIGIMYGCFSYNNKVMLSDGSFEKIGKIVNNKLPLKVMSLNLDTGKIEPKKIIDWHNNGIIDNSMLKIKFKRSFNNSHGSFMCTPNHKIIIKQNNDFITKSAKDLRVGDKLTIMAEEFISQDQLQVIYGSILGDGNIRRDKGHNSHFRVAHGIKQKDYLQMKASLLDNLSLHNDNIKIKDNRCDFYTRSMQELNRLKYYTKDQNKNRHFFIPEEIINNINELGLAIWYLDDGTYAGSHDYWGAGKSNICCKKFPDKEKLLPVFKKYGLNPSLEDVGFVFNAEETLKFHELICRFVPESMSYKLHPKYRNLYGFNFNKVNPKIVTTQEEIIKVESNYYPPIKMKFKYDLTIEDNSTYCVGGAFVHNSNRTTAGGGRALEYYSSSRFELRANKIPKDKRGNVLGVKITIGNTKNRCAKPFMEAKDVYLFFEQGVNPFGGLLELLLKEGRINSNSPGNYVVNEPWAGGKEIKFKSSKERNDIPIEILLDCPALIDAESTEQVQYYVDMFNSAINTEIAEETNVASNESLD